MPRTIEGTNVVSHYMTNARLTARHTPGYFRCDESSDMVLAEKTLPGGRLLGRITGLFLGGRGAWIVISAIAVELRH
jgi:hypothetical protein